MTAAIGLDLTACDREPIHIPGAIQPHGLLLVAEAATLRIVAGAGELEARLAGDWLGRTLPDLLGGDPVTYLAATSAGPLLGGVVERGGKRYDVTLHRSGDRLLVELEPAFESPVAAATVLGWLDSIASGFERAGDLQALCERAATAFRVLTGFDRVMVYRFLDDDAGRVIAEDRDPALGTFLHHHFPASDIPRQARALYVRNRARAIPDIVYDPAPLRPAGETIDLSDVAVRSVSPVHLHYLHNMGVRASASISIVKDGLLWGLIACHHNSPRLLPAGLRATASALASGLARQIRAKEEAETYRERLRLRAAEDAVLPKLASEGTSRRTVAAVREDLRRMLGADGFAFVQGEAADLWGACPPEGEVIELAHWVRRRGVVEPVATHELDTLVPAAAAYRQAASGLIAMPLADENIVLLWFRAELLEEIEWAGNPHKAVTADPGAALTPRSSFASWTEAVRGRAKPWTLQEVEAAYRLRRAFHDAYRNQRLRELNQDLQRTLADRDALIVQKDVLMKEVNHRVQNSLQLVSAFLALQARAAGEGELATQLGEAQARLSAVALVHRRLYRDDQVETVDLSRYLEELAGDLKSSLGPGWAARMRIDLAPVLIPTDRAVNVGLILTELVINATKYAYGGAAGPITILLEQHRNRLRLIVADEGRGKTGDGQGFGSRMMNAMVASLGGDIAFDDNRPGLRAIVTVPIQAAR